MPSPTLVTEHYHPCSRTSWMKTQLHFIHFFFFPVPLFCSSAFFFSLCVVCQCHPHHCCHQLVQLVSKRWSHCACLILFLFSITLLLSMHALLWHSTNSTTNLILDLSTSNSEKLWVYNITSLSSWGFYSICALI